VSIPAVQVVISLALSIAALALLVKKTLLIEVLLMHFLKSFENQTQVYILD